MCEDTSQIGVNILAPFPSDAFPACRLHGEPHVAERNEVGVLDPSAGGAVGQAVLMQVVVRLYPFATCDGRTKPGENVPQGELCRHVQLIG